MQIHSLQPARGSRKRRKRLGRGNASGRGTYSTRGIKGQRSRSGGKKGLKLKGLRRTIKRIPKKRGFRSLRPKRSIVTLETLDRFFDDAEVVTAQKLHEKKIIGTIERGFKVLSKGTLTKKLQVEVHAISAKAKEVIESKGGTVTILSTRNKARNSKSKTDSKSQLHKS